MNGNNGYGKWDKRMFVLAALALIVGLATSTYGFILVHESNMIAQSNYDLQNMLSNFTSVIVPNSQSSQLDEQGNYHSILPTVSVGWLNGSITIVTPHYGNLTVGLINFTVSDYYDNLVPEETNLTTVTSTLEYKLRALRARKTNSNFVTT